MIIQNIMKMNPIVQIQKLAGMIPVPAVAGRNIKNAVLKIRFFTGKGSA
jgi:hypothetical protein